MSTLKNITIGAIATLAVIAIPTSVSATDNHEAVSICHATGNGTYVIIGPDNSSSHMNHDGGLKHGDKPAVNGECPPDATTTTTTTTTTQAPTTTAAPTTIAAPTTTTSPTSAPIVGRPPVCHNTGNGTYIFISADSIAIEQHFDENGNLRHGDKFTTDGECPFDATTTTIRTFPEGCIDEICIGGPPSSTIFTPCAEGAVSRVLPSGLTTCEFPPESPALIPPINEPATVVTMTVCVETPELCKPGTSSPTSTVSPLLPETGRDNNMLIVVAIVMLFSGTGALVLARRK